MGNQPILICTANTCTGFGKFFESQANHSFSSPINQQNSAKSQWPFPCLIFLHAPKQSMELDSRVRFGIWGYPFESGSFLPPSAVSTLKPNLLPWTVSASSVIVDTDLFFGSVLGSQAIFLQISRTMDTAYIQLVFPCCFRLNSGILFPGILATGSPSKVRLSLPNLCHTREQHFCRKSSYS